MKTIKLVGESYYYCPACKTMYYLKTECDCDKTPEYNPHLMDALNNNTREV